MPDISTENIIATYTIPSAVSSYTFTSIPNTYTDLILIGSSKLSVSEDYIKLRFNGDTSTNYSDTVLMATTSGVDFFRVTNQTSNTVGYSNNTAFSPLIVNIMNYSNTSTYKTCISRNSSTTRVENTASLWRKTPEAINSVTILAGAGNLAADSTFTIYGIL
jgi:hypothetical protein